MWTPTTRRQHSRDQPALWKRPDRCGVGDPLSVAAASGQDGPAARMVDAGDHERNLLRAALWLRLADDSEMLSAGDHGLRLVSALPP